MSWYGISLLAVTILITANGDSESEQKCYFEEEGTIESGIPEVPDFLSSRTETHLCRGSEMGKLALKCGEKEFILQRCVCSYHHVSNSIYHTYTACPGNSLADSVNYLTCEDCRNYSVDNKGPCLNNGTINCAFSGHLASDIKCSCPKGFSGRFCENKIVQYRICLKDPRVSNLSDCENTQEKECKKNLASGIFRCPLKYSEEKTGPHCNSPDSVTSTRFTMTNSIAAHHVINSCRNFQTTFVFSVFLQYLLSCYI
ncbi:uncharacterized protein LOC130046502 isoform X3 [Ostrea edulis]|uniref:uncharacterized protein LOC130046502 isoform X3 n=1 Tax=Ostrea edulis TaxID=37623 RepID=UPI0024AEB1F5|nr:uncharacterized protein LOC130046502 isoform X3 [Ostrea edulis]XP_055998458.1 uncharacterized protein LOC130046502 isoform X3 [Ostrea edulis]XP_055998459.1 uncharacterized protein LOC130046502 isoform X3 [Ostrea edulis]XP_055998460.1 uncharacterized protein LOC130046502 isoform X3 [Ostrea edulis]XP_055998461.1 uncharacterized protein LOC130046502 isoform X3 [Ostrea edulis]XP_055998462.1 uncharacterized protein LOC130046502 isoform X3 [Ostrea edulis]XP_055998463.1 uncharacterized protein LO